MLEKVLLPEEIRPILPFMSEHPHPHSHLGKEEAIRALEKHLDAISPEIIQKLGEDKSSIIKTKGRVSLTVKGVDD
jgi:hypothetical protein